MKTLNAIARVVATTTLAVMLVTAGLFVCCARPTTELLAQATSNDALSPYDKDTLVNLALLTRDYTVDGAERAAALDAIARMTENASAGGSGTNEKSAAGAANSTDNGESNGKAKGPTAKTPQKSDERYTLTKDAIYHLDDVYKVIEKAKFAALAIALLCAASLAHVAVRCGAADVARVLKYAALGVIALFAALAAWVLIDFNGFFAAFHSLFFADGTWTFSSDSLLICMYPPEFWMGMGAVWLATTVAGCAVCFIISWLLRKRVS